MLALAERVGKHRAHELIHRAALAGQERGVDFATALADDAGVARELPDAAQLLTPERALGATGALVDAVLARAERP